MALVHKAQPLSGGNKLYLYKNGVTNTDFVTSWETRNGATIGENTLEFPTFWGDKNYSGRDIYSSNEVNLSGYKAICARLNVSTVGTMNANSTFYLMLSPTKTRNIAQAYAFASLGGNVAPTDKEIIMSSPILNDIAYICMFSIVYYPSDAITVSISEIWLEE